ncbi:MAG: hypothetical protein A2020_14615 [Lentisphaerae bacterium GWF2_45_14]|nr:MAG: hypothetical protein A2020_14615 [Lentisphaerae bacterium GWF2_45_14]
MIKFSIVNLDRDGTDLSGSEPASILEIEDSDLLSCHSPIEYNLHAALVNNGILVTGSASTEINLKCGRCLKSFKYQVSSRNMCHFYEKVKNQELDVTEEIREDILVAFPNAYLCKKNCKGLCPKCGTNLNKSECSCAEEESPVLESSEEKSPWIELDKLKIEPRVKKR